MTWQYSAGVQDLGLSFPQHGRAHNHFRPDRSRAICTYATGTHRELAAISIEASRRYARRWGWDVVASCEPELAAGRPPSWAKVALVSDLLRRYEWIWLIDADALIVDLDRDVMAEIDPSGPPIWMAMHGQGGNADHAVENAGVMLVRACAEAVGFLAEVWRQEQFIDHNWWENAAILHLLGRALEPPYLQTSSPEARSLIGRLPLAWNAVPGMLDVDDSALHHHARADHDNFAWRVERMRSDLAHTTGSGHRPKAGINRDPPARPETRPASQTALTQGDVRD